MIDNQFDEPTWLITCSCGAKTIVYPVLDQARTVHQAMDTTWRFEDDDGWNCGVEGHYQMHATLCGSRNNRRECVIG